ncbi:unnamed protein product [Cylicocyclus nassatus]|uniref:Apple domain-containing protein n=1 Tax=Cylicocyclus nassatus TaxID=53992 RepID=A0AA36M791_CYLNA|nr:unnamed protein product [Cylicocyclus nassatus]
MKSLVVVLLFAQAFRALSCAFDRVETLTGNRTCWKFDDINESECFAKCFQIKACIGIRVSTDAACTSLGILNTRNKTEPFCTPFNATIWIRPHARDL